MIDLAPFCSTDPERPFLHHPFSRGDYSYATNGHVLVRVARRDDVPEIKEAPHAERLFTEPAPVEMMPLPAYEEFPEPTVDECDACGGRGHRHDCPDCNCECGHCSGSGLIFELITAQIGEAIYQTKYLTLIGALPNIHVPRSPPPGLAPMRFLFDGGEGLLCGYAKPGQRHIEEPK